MIGTFTTQGMMSADRPGVILSLSEGCAQEMPKNDLDTIREVLEITWDVPIGNLLLLLT
jgi:hypothetical protein